MTPRLFREMGIYVCDDMIINTRRTCPYKIKLLMDGVIKTIPDQEQEKKKYFKAIVKGQDMVPNINRNKNGDKSTDELRIVERGRFVKCHLFKRGVVINDMNVDMPLISLVGNWNGIKVWFEDIIDVFPTNVDNKLSSLILYLTSNVQSNYFSQSFPDNCSYACWDEPRFIDKVKALMTHHLCRNFKLSHQLKKYKDDFRHGMLFTPAWNIKYGEMTVNYIVADLRPEKAGTMNYTEVNYGCTPERLGICEDIAREAAIVYNALELEGWTTCSPNETSCADCPVKCDKKHVVKEV